MTTRGGNVFNVVSKQHRLLRRWGEFPFCFLPLIRKWIHVDLSYHQNLIKKTLRLKAKIFR